MGVGLALGGYVFILVGLLPRGREWRVVLIAAATVWGMLVVLITELLSLSQWLTHRGLSVAWLVVDGVTLAYCWQAVRLQSWPSDWRVLRPRPRPWAPTVPTMSLFLLAGVSVIMVFVAVVALASPANTWDAMAYHLPRVVQWMQQGSVAFYPTRPILIHERSAGWGHPVIEPPA